MADDILDFERFPRSSKYNPEWVIASASGGANSLWLTEWLASAMDLQPGMRVLDLGCGRAASSIFLHREYGVEVGATDLWFDPAENQERIRNAGLSGGVVPVWADARSLPFEPECFDAIICIDSYPYFGTDDLYLNYLAQFVKPGGQIAIAGAGLMQEIEGEVPEHLRAWWTHDLWILHSAAWWRRHWERTGIVKVETADTMEDGWKVWLDWHRTVAPDNATEIRTVEEDAGRFLGYVRVVGRRNAEVTLQEYCWPNMRVPPQYTRVPLLRDGSLPLPPTLYRSPSGDSRPPTPHVIEDDDVNFLVPVQDVIDLVSTDLKLEPEEAGRLTRCVLYWYGCMLGAGNATDNVTSLKKTLEKIKPSLFKVLQGAEPYAASSIKNGIEWMDSQIEDLVKMIGKGDRNSSGSG